MFRFLLSPRFPPSTRHGGFTLVEILVVVSVSIILSAFALQYSLVSQYTTALSIERVEVGQFILKAKALTLSTRLRSNLSRPCGYGVWIDYSASGSPLYLFSYSLPASPSGAQSPCSALRAGSQRLDVTNANNYQQMESLTLEEGVRFVSPSPSPRLDMVFFLTPDPTTLVWADGARVAGDRGLVSLQTIQGNATGTVTVTSGGEVSF